MPSAPRVTVAMRPDETPSVPSSAHRHTVAWTLLGLAAYAAGWAQGVGEPLPVEWVERFEQAQREMADAD